MANQSPGLDPIEYLTVCLLPWQPTLWARFGPRACSWTPVERLFVNNRWWHPAQVAQMFMKTVFSLEIRRATFHFWVSDIIVYFRKVKRLFGLKLRHEDNFCLFTGKLLAAALMKHEGGRRRHLSSPTLPGDGCWLAAVHDTKQLSAQAHGWGFKLHKVLISCFKYLKIF